MLRPRVYLELIQIKWRLQYYLSCVHMQLYHAALKRKSVYYFFSPRDSPISKRYLPANKLIISEPSCCLPVLFRTIEFIYMICNILSFFPLEPSISHISGLQSAWKRGILYTFKNRHFHFQEYFFTDN